VEKPPCVCQGSDTWVNTPKKLLHLIGLTRLENPPIKPTP